MPEQEIAPEIQQEALNAQLDQELEKEPEIPADRRMIFDSLSRNKEVALAGLLITAFMLSGKEARADYYAESGTKLKKEDLVQALEKGGKYEKGLEDEAVELGLGLKSLQEQREKETEGSAKYGKIGDIMIKRLATMMNFCYKRGVDFDKVYDTSKIKPEIMQAASEEFSENLALSEKQDRKPQAKLEKTLPQQEKLGKKSR